MAGNIPVIYEDDWLLVADKPSGLLVIPTPKKEERTLTSILGLYPCHRLDRETSGLIIYAKNKSVQQKMAEKFKQKNIRKTYIAFVRGSPRKPEGEIRIPIEGSSAVTGYKVIEKRKDFAIVKVMPVTGRTNQIRIHFKSMGNPLLGERVFAFRKDFPVKAKRLCLHAQDLDFFHPVTRRQMNLHSPMPSDLKEFLEKHPE